ncbi:MAG: hypothetical protein ACTSYS_08310 [Promethearchaeota archaeon]
MKNDECYFSRIQIGRFSKDFYQKIILITAYSSIHSLIEAIRSNVNDILIKPVTPSNLINIVKDASSLKDPK